MLNPFNASNNLDELVFANRNKTYGAYSLRKEYDARITKSVFIVLGSFVLLFISALIYSNVYPVVTPLKKAPEVPPTFLDNTIFEIDMSRGGNMATSTSQPATTPTSSSTPNRVDEYNFQITTTTTVDNIETSPTDNSGTSHSQEGNHTNNTGGGDISGTETGGSGTGGDVVNAPMVTFVPDVFPEFLNGNLHTYLASQINYPPQALAAGVQGKVIIMFDVLADGTIANVTLKRGIGFGCDEEALRVVKNMPRWKPGKQQGKSVAVRMNLPIKFETVN
jgi:protein TonB